MFAPSHLVAVCAVVAFLANLSSAQNDTLRIGDKAPSFVLRDVSNDEPVFLRDHVEGPTRFAQKKPDPRVVVLSFWATWCQPCAVEIPLLHELSRSYKADEVSFFLVHTMDSTSDSALKRTLKDRNYTLVCLEDALSRVARKYGIRTLPATVIIDRRGIVRLIERGYQSGSEEALKKTLNGILAEKAK